MALLAGLLFWAAVQTPDTLTLESALDRAAELRPVVQVASATAARARAMYRVAGIVPNPVAQLELNEASPTSKVTVTQDLSWVLRRGPERSAARAGITRGKADSARVLADLGRAVRYAFAGALAGTARVRIARELGGIADSVARSADLRLAAGDISRLDRDRIVQEASRVRLAVSHAEETARVSVVTLVRALGWTDVEPPVLAGALDRGLDEAAAGAPGHGSESSPEILGARADSLATAERARALGIARIPVPGLLVGREWGGARGTAILGFFMPIPIWSRGNEQVAEARAAADSSAAAAREVRLDVAARLASARVRVQEAARRARLSRDSLVPAARSLRERTTRLYETGHADILLVFDALRSERDMAQVMVDELLGFQQAQADVLALLGRWK